MKKLTLLMLAAAPAISLSQGFRNGSFSEGPYDKTKGFIELVKGSTAITGWEVTDGNVDWVATNPQSDWDASDGKRSIDLSGTTAGAISQTFATKPGHLYCVSFDFAGNPLGAPEVKQMTISVDGAQAKTYSFSIKGHSASKMGWAHKAYVFKAGTSTTSLKFASLTMTAYGPVIARVRVAELIPPKPKKAAKAKG